MAGPGPSTASAPLKVKNRRGSLPQLPDAPPYVPSEPLRPQGIDSSKPSTSGSSSMMERLKKAHALREQSERALEQSNEDYQELMDENQRLRKRLEAAEDAIKRDKKSLSEEIVELRKRLDDTNPDLARKETMVTQSHFDLRRAQARILQLEQRTEELEGQLSHQNKENNLRLQLDEERKRELQQSLESIQELEKRLDHCQNDIQRQKDEITFLERNLREKELQLKKERLVTAKINDDNESLIRENADLNAKLSTAHRFMETQKDSWMPSEDTDKVFADLLKTRESERNLRQELLRTEEKVRASELKLQHIAAKLSEQQLQEQDSQETCAKLKERLDSLEKFSRDLTAENKKLRQDAMQVDTKTSDLRKMLALKDQEFASLREQFQTIEQRYNDLLKQYEQEISLQNEKYREFERLASEVHSLARHSGSPSVASPNENLYRDESSSHGY